MTENIFDGESFYLFSFRLIGPGKVEKYRRYLFEHNATEMCYVKK